MQYGFYLLLTLIPTYLIRFSLGPIRTNLFEVLTLLVGIGLLITFKWESVKYLSSFVKKFPEYSILLICSTIGIIVSSSQIASLGVWKSYFVIPLLISYYFYFLYTKSLTKLQQQELIQQSLVSLGVASSLVSITTLYQLVLNVQGLNGRPTSIYAVGMDKNLSSGGFSNYISLFILPITFVLIGLGLESKNTKTKYLSYTLALINILALFASQSYGALISFVIISLSTILYFLIRQKVSLSLKKYLGGAISLIIIATILFFMTQIQTPKFQNLFDMTSRNSLSSRLQIWHASWVIASQNWAFGIGLSDFQRVYQQVIPTLYFPPHEWLVPEPHNLYLASIIHLGLIGLITILYILYTIIHRFVYNSKIQSGSLLVSGILCGLLSIYLYGLFDTTFWKNDLAVVFFVLLTVYKLEVKPKL